VRRIEAVPGQGTLKRMEKHTRLIMELADRVKAKPEDLLARADARTGELRELRQSLEKLRVKEMLADAEGFLTAAKTVEGMRVVTARIPETDADSLRKIGDFLRDKEENVVAVLSTVREGKIQFLAVCGKAAVAAGIKAGDIIRSVTAICGGKGGGKPDSAMGGGADLLKLDDALASVDDFVAEKIKP
jgi:alanyl-tRNA synthetase